MRREKEGESETREKRRKTRKQREERMSAKGGDVKKVSLVWFLSLDGWTTLWFQFFVGFPTFRERRSVNGCDFCHHSILFLFLLFCSSFFLLSSSSFYEGENPRRWENREATELEYRTEAKSSKRKREWKWAKYQFVWYSVHDLVNKECVQHDSIPFSFLSSPFSPSFILLSSQLFFSLPLL